MFSFWEERERIPNYNQEEEKRIRASRMERFKLLKSQLEIFTRLIAEGPLDLETPVVRKTIHRGIPSQLRGSLWPQIFPNKHGITKEFYAMLLTKSMYVRDHVYEFQDSWSKIDTLKLIKTDIGRTFVDLKLFKENTEMGQALEELLTCWTVYRQDIGYVQGMSVLAAYLLTELKDHEQSKYPSQQFNYHCSAFSIFSSIVTSPILVDHFTFNLQEVGRFERIFEETFRKNNESLFQHFKEQDIITRMYLFEWIVTLFARCLQFEVLGRLWDVMLLHQLQPRFLVEVCYGIIHACRKDLVKMEGEQVLRYLKNIRIDSEKEKQLFDHLAKFDKP